MRDTVKTPNEAPDYHFEGGCLYLLHQLDFKETPLEEQ